MGTAEAGVRKIPHFVQDKLICCAPLTKRFPRSCARPGAARDGGWSNNHRFQAPRIHLSRSQSGVTAKHNHPFVLRLIVPEIWRATVGARHDALDVRRAALKKPKKIFRTNLLRQIGKNIFYLDVHNQPFTRRARLIAGTSMMRRWPRSGGFSAAEIMAVMNCSIVTKPSLSALARVPGNDSAIL